MKRSKQQLGAYSRRKGTAFERQGALMFTEWTGLPCRRTPGSGSYGHEWGLAGDLMFHGEGSPHIMVELKRREGWTWPAIFTGKGPIFGWWTRLCREADEAPNKPNPVLIFKKNRGSIWVATRPWNAVVSGGTLPIRRPRTPIIRLPSERMTICRATDIITWKDTC